MLVRGVVAGSLMLSALGASPGIAATDTPPGSSNTSLSWTAPMSSPTSPVAAKKVQPRRIVVKVTGQRLGRRAIITVKGVKGKAKGTTKTLRVKKRTTVKRPKPGVYRISAKRITAQNRTATPIVTPQRVRVTATRGAAVSVAYRAVSTQGPEPTPSRTPPTSLPPDSPRTEGSSGEVSQMVQPGVTTTVSAVGGYAITLPPGALQAPATVTVRPLPAASGLLPGADFNIAESWAGPVDVTVPLPPGAPDAVVLHEAAGGLRITSGSAVRRTREGTTSTATVAATTLSPFYGVSVDCSDLTRPAADLMCGDHAERPLDELLAAQGTQAAQSGTASQQVRAAAVSDSDCPNSSPLMVSLGSLASGISCSEALEGTTGAWSFTNTTKASYLGGLYTSGVVFTMAVSGTFDRSQQMPIDTPLLLGILAKPIQDAFLFPSEKTTVRKTHEDGVSFVETDANAGMTPLWASAGFLMGLLGEKILKQLDEFPEAQLRVRVVRCGANLSGTWTASTIGCLKDVLIDALKAYAKTGISARFLASAALAKILSGGDLLMVGNSMWRAIKSKWDTGLGTARLGIGVERSGGSGLICGVEPDGTAWCEPAGE